MPQRVILLLAIVYLFTLLVGRVLERLHIPWVFASLLFGMGFAFYNPFPSATDASSFLFLAQLGMYFFIFVIGFEVDLAEIRERSGFMIRTATVIILVETVLGGAFIHYLFGTGWVVALYVAHFFATVGEAVLLPILKEFGLFETDLGQAIVGVGVVDDTFEILSIVLLPFVISYATTSGADHLDVVLVLGALAVLFGLTYISLRLGRSEALQFGESGVEEGTLFLFVLVVILGFVYVGQFAHAGILGALFAGVATKDSLPKAQLEQMTTKVKGVTFGIFGPLFFFWVGSDISITVPEQLGVLQGMPVVVAFALLVVGKILYVKSAKIGGVLVAARDRFDVRQRVVMGIALSVKFSTSIVLVKIMFEEGLIEDALYSVLITSKIGFKFVVPILLALLVPRWGIDTVE